MQFAGQRMALGGAQFRTAFLGVGADTFVATRHLKQLSVLRYIPVPGQLGICKCLIECRQVKIKFAVDQCAVKIEQQAAKEPVVCLRVGRTH